MNFKVGIGYDIHILQKDRALILGGVEIPYSEGLLGHSDGDVLIHAVIDALLGACGERDIGSYFPDTEENYKGMSSILLLKQIKERILDNNQLQVNNLDTVIIAQRPMLAPFVEDIRQKLADILEMEKRNIAVKSKTNEGLDSLGQGKAIAAYAIVSLIGNNDLE